MNKNSYSHVYLYSKGWYQKNDAIEDLKVILGHRCGIDPKYVAVETILECLLSLVYKYFISGNNGALRFREFMFDCFKYKNWGSNCITSLFVTRDSITDGETVILNCLGKISIVEISDIEDGLEDPDYSILPQSEDSKHIDHIKALKPLFDGHLNPMPIES